MSLKRHYIDVTLFISKPLYSKRERMNLNTFQRIALLQDLCRVNRRRVKMHLLCKFDWRKANETLTFIDMHAINTFDYVIIYNTTSI